MSRETGSVAGSSRMGTTRHVSPGMRHIGGIWGAEGQHPPPQGLFASWGSAHLQEENGDARVRPCSCTHSFTNYRASTLRDCFRLKRNDKMTKGGVSEPSPLPILSFPQSLRVGAAMEEK